MKFVKCPVSPSTKSDQTMFGFVTNVLQDRL